MTCSIDAILSYMRHTNGQDTSFQDLHEKARNFVITVQSPHDPKANTEGWYNIDVVSHLLSGLSQRVRKIWTSRGFEDAPSTHSIRSDGTNHWVYIDLRTRMIHEGPGQRRPIVAADLVRYYRGICVSSNALHQTTKATQRIDPEDELAICLELSRQMEMEREERESRKVVDLLVSEDLALSEQMQTDRAIAIAMGAG